MDDFAAQEPDEGYSEDPLNPTAATQGAGYLGKPRGDAVSALATSRSTADFPDWLTRHIAGLTVHDKTREFCFSSGLLHCFDMRKRPVMPCHLLQLRSQQLVRVVALVPRALYDMDFSRLTTI